MTLLLVLKKVSNGFFGSYGFGSPSATASSSYYDSHVCDVTWLQTHGGFKFYQAHLGFKPLTANKISQVHMTIEEEDNTLIHFSIIQFMKVSSLSTWRKMRVLLSHKSPFSTKILQIQDVILPSCGGVLEIISLRILRVNQKQRFCDTLLSSTSSSLSASIHGRIFDSLRMEINSRKIFDSWSLYAEQKMNAILLTEDIRVAFREHAGDDGVVRKEEVAIVVKGLREVKKDDGSSTKN
ncbi:predicted protein [Arabidopsis lyrata subsp. lyrata]|uniref:Predicted protein n=1 Tax=Arabidopsis lyrata subsp. lyrata TaxID=81972 RepID=D7LJJ8_ARALL|nr:predicted protein [Arabidopsis lyrata subsp. lyrata]